MQERERPKIAPKPIIATKPKFVPPVKLQQKVPQGPPPPPEPQRRTSCGGEIPKRVQSKFDPGGGAKVFFAQSDKEPLYHQHKKTLEVNQKPPNSPSTVCCSILSNAAHDCYGIINSNGKKLTKLDSVDSASSDSGGFKDFHYHHQRKISQPDFLTETKPSGHQRKTSQPNFDNNKPKYVPNAQALAQFLPQTEQKIFMHQQQKVIQQQVEEGRKPKPILSHGNIQESTKKLEELLAQRLEKERMLMMTEKKKMVESAGGEEGGGGGGTAEQKVRQMHQKLHQDLEQTVKQIQEMQSTEYRLPQNRKWESNRSQPAIGLKHTPKSRPTIFGTVAPSDLTPKDCSNRRSLPQTPTIKSYSTIFSSGETHQESPGDSGIQQDNALVYRDGNLLSGPLEALILHTVPTESYYPDRAYLFAFLLSARLFIKPHDLLSKVRHLGEQQQGLAPQQTRFAEKMVQLLAEWTEQFPYDFRDERMMDHVRKVTQQCCAIDPALRSNVSLLLHNLHPKLASLEEYEQLLEKQTNSTITATSSDENISCPDVSEVCPSPEKLAQQLTHLELERLSFIGPEEFVQAFAKENPALETSFKDLKKTRNLEQYVQWFNRLSYFVATQVCKYQKKKQRVKMVEYWIETGRECFNIGNFNSLMAIIAGLNMSPISRLKKTWNKIQSGKFAILEHQMDPSSNFSSYRSTLKAAMWRSAGATDQRQRIVIPFFSLLVKDLYFLNQGCSNKLPNGHINFEKFWQLAKQVTEFMAWKQVTCPFERDPKVIALLQHAAIMNENALALASFECEPPDNNQEKERCKNLKAEGGGGGSGGSNTN
ncbi:ras-GEF domain-containing family member 1B-like isoform X1 [Anthonomus grandis grandis]|uniref:ras-GEF domain-containing family member 1B-like isoform X1 n=1 Tax=Anthonomus grandis grandis TaxID=2921223 RepID=UPI0021662BA9|nr:ras-GEF domain-containing family member 1B-like isoform X1 [Anthonomus grandis grandis]